MADSDAGLVRLTTRIPAHLDERLRWAMFEQRRSQQDLIAAALETYLDTVPDGVMDGNEKGEPDQDPNGSPRGSG